MFGRKRKMALTPEQGATAWQLGGLWAYQSLEDEIKGDAARTGEFALPPTDAEEGRVFFEEVAALPDDPVRRVAFYVAETLRGTDTLDDLNKRLTFRQSVIAARLLSGDDEAMRWCLCSESSFLELEPIPMDWIDRLPIDLWSQETEL